LRLDDMLTAIDRMLDKLDLGQEAFENDEMLQVWMVHHLEILGEAAGALESRVRESNPQVPWRQIIATRNRLMHGYFDVDLGVVWNVVERELPVLREQIEQIIEDLSEEDDAQ
jgi:uncharacterized protein with HEPN domain